MELTPVRVLPLVSPSIGVRGMVSSQDPAALGPGTFPLLVNLRFYSRTLRVRWGAVKLTSAVPVASASFRGAWSGKMNGADLILAAYRVAGATRVYSLNPSTYVWTEITASATRFATDGFIGFAAVRDSSVLGGVDCLVMGNGADSPRVYCNTVAGSGAAAGIAKHDAITAPDRATQTAMAACWLKVKDATTTNYTATGGLTMADTDPSSTTANQIRVQVTSGTAVGATAEATFTSASDFNGGSAFYLSGSLCFACQNGRVDDTRSVWDYVGKVEVWGALGASPADWHVVWDASSSAYATPATYPVEAGDDFAAYVKAFDTSPAGSVSNITKVRLTASGAPSSTFNDYINNVFSSGLAPGDSLYAVAYYNASSRAESVATVASRSGGTRLSAIGGTDYFPARELPTASGLRCVARIQFPDSGDTTVTHALVYRSDAVTDPGTGETTYGPFEYLGGNGPFSLPGNPLAGTLNSKYDNGTAKDPTRIARDEAHLPIPAGLQLLTANDRLLVGGLSSAQGELWISEDRNPFSFRKALRVDDFGEAEAASPVYRTFPGESVTALVRLSGVLSGVGAVMVMTDRATYRVNGFDAQSLSLASVLGNRGTLYPRTVCVYDNRVWFLDNEGQVRVVDGGSLSEPVTYGLVDDRLSQGVLTNACAYAAFDRFEVFYRGVDPATSAADSPNREGLFFDGTLGDSQGWCLDRFSAFDVAGVLTVDSASGRKAYAFTETGDVWELERKDQASEGGLAIPFRIHCAELHEGMWRPQYWGRMGIVADAATSTLLTTELHTPYDGVTTPGVFALGAATSEAFTWNHRGASDYAPVGVSGVSCQPKVYGALSGGKRIRSLVIETREGGQGATTL